MSTTVEFLAEFNPEIPSLLPLDKVYLIQVGGKLFKLSGASLSSDGPSHFTDFFQQPENLDKILCIDRNPDVFNLIYMHLQGYQINVENDYQFVHLYLDSYYYSLRRLQRFLAEDDLFATVGNVSFKIARTLFTSTGNFPNYFTISYNSMLTNNFEIIQIKNMIRPPPQKPVTVPNRSPKLFNDLLELLKRNPLVIENEEHRSLLIRECKYYRFAELEQQIIKYKIVNNPFSPDNKQEIIIGLKDISPKGLINEQPIDIKHEVALQYQRPCIAREPKRTLIFQLDSTSCEIFNKDYSEVKLILNKSTKLMILQISNKLCLKYVLLFKTLNEEIVAHTLDCGAPQISVLVGLRDSKAKINGMDMKKDWVNDLLGPPVNDATDDQNNAKRRRTDIVGDIIEFKLTRSLWRVMMRGKNIRLHAVSFEGLTDQSSFIRQEIDFL